MSREAVLEALLQVAEGRDFPAPKAMLSRITADQASQHLPGMPYSIATNVLHAEFWQRIWLGRLFGRPRPNMTKDWRVPAPEEWSDIRSAFLAGLDEAIELAKSKAFAHAMKSDDVAHKTLLQIAVHDAYHLGQINLLKRALRLAAKSDDG